MVFMEVLPRGQCELRSDLAEICILTIASVGSFVLSASPFATSAQELLGSTGSSDWKQPLVYFGHRQ